MKFLLVLVVLVAATFADPKGDSAGKLAEISKKLEEQSKKVQDQNQRQEEQDRQREEQNKKLEEQYKRSEAMKEILAEQRAENERLEKEVANQKMENLEARKTEAILRQADAQLRAADARILQTNEKQTSELRRELIKLIDSEIRRLRPRKIGEIVLLPYQGSAGATTTMHSNFLPKYAFMNTSRVWNSDIRSLPQWVWFNFSKPHRLARIGFPSHVNEQYPKKFQVVGSSDCASWSVMLRVEISDGTREFKSWDIPVENRTPFRCIGLKVEKCWEGQRGKYIELHKVQMWEEK